MDDISAMGYSGRVMVARTLFEILRDLLLCKMLLLV